MSCILHSTEVGALDVQSDTVEPANDKVLRKSTRAGTVMAVREGRGGHGEADLHPEGPGPPCPLKQRGESQTPGGNVPFNGREAVIFKIF